MCNTCLLSLLCPLKGKPNCVFNEAEKLHLTLEFRRRIFKEYKEKEQRDESMPTN